MIITWVLTIAAFVIIFIEVKGWSMVNKRLLISNRFDINLLYTSFRLTTRTQFWAQLQRFFVSSNPLELSSGKILNCQIYAPLPNRFPFKTFFADLIPEARTDRCSIGCIGWGKNLKWNSSIERMNDKPFHQQWKLGSHFGHRYNLLRREVRKSWTPRMDGLHFSGIRCVPCHHSFNLFCECDSSTSKIMNSSTTFWHRERMKSVIELTIYSD